MRRIVIGSSASPRRLQRRRIVWAAAMPLASTGCAWLDEMQRQLALRPTPGRPDDADDPARWRPGDRRFMRPSTAAPDQTLALRWLPRADLASGAAWARG